MKRYALITVALVVVGANTVGGGQVYMFRPNPPTDGLVGANYTPAYAVNQVQFWHDFRGEIVEKELAAAQKYFGIKTLRVYLHNINFDEEKDVFLANIEKFLQLCEKYGIKPGFVFFDDCHKSQGWSDTDVTDIVDAHIYHWNPSAWDRLADANIKKGTVFTEAGARWNAPRRSNGEPCEVLNWLQRRRASGRSTPGIYLCWELMVGNSNCRWHWVDKPDAPEPTVPWCGLMWPDGTPVSLAEAEAVHRYVTGQPRVMFFDDFEDAPPPPSRPGWTTYGGAGQGGSGYLALEPVMKMVAGDAKWTDYVIEGRVMLKSEKRGNAGLIFRVNDAGPAYDEMRGYYVGLGTRKLYLGKMDNNWQPLAEFDLGKLDCKVAPEVWNQIRVAVEGPRIRVWLNRMHPSTDPDRGLRIDFTDEKQPILSGAIGVRAHLVPAWFDNIVALPLDELPESSSACADMTSTAR